MSKLKHLYAIFILSAGFGLSAFAQIDHQETNSPHHDSVIHLSPVQVLGESGEEGALRAVPTVSAMEGDQLFQKARSSLGETLDKETGVSSTQFGAAASRPVIRGLEGDRIRILQNGIGVLDASGTSQDHAVPLSPLASESVEIVRGPINLLYGSSAIGGVVNVVNSRIHRHYSEGVSGGLDLKGDTVSDRTALAGQLDYGVSNLMIHLDGDGAKSSLLRTPTGRVENSESRHNSQALGLSYFFPSQSYIGMSYSDYSSRYGVVSEPDVDIDMNQQRWDLAGHMKLQGFFKSLQIKSGQTFYKHEELEGQEVGTTFKNQGNETRIELAQARRKGLSGVVGLQVNVLERSALGEEAFLPTTNTSQGALFAYEEWAQEDMKWSLGWRGEWSEAVAHAGASYSQDQTKSFFANSLAAGVLKDLSPSFSSGFNASYSERAPTYQELFAQGNHVALGLYEQGFVDLKKEKAVAMEWTLRGQKAPLLGMLSIFGQHFEDFISLSPTGGTDPDEGFPIYNYESQRAQIFGAEISFEYQIHPSWEFRGKGDYLRGINLTADESLPRMTPPRLTAELAHKWKQLTTSLEVQQVFRQIHVAPNETETASYRMLNLRAFYDWAQENSRFALYGQLDNLTNEEARNHISLVKDKMQLGGRSLSLGLRAYF